MVSGLFLENGLVSWVFLASYLFLYSGHWRCVGEHCIGLGFLWTLFVPFFYRVRCLFGFPWRLVSLFWLGRGSAEFMFGFFYTIPFFLFRSLSVWRLVCVSGALHLGSGSDFALAFCFCFVLFGGLFLPGSAWSYSGNVFHVLWGCFFLPERWPLFWIYVFSCASLRVCLEKLCSDWVDFCFSVLSCPQYGEGILFPANTLLCWW